MIVLYTNVDKTFQYSLEFNYTMNEIPGAQGSHVYRLLLH